MDLRDETSLQQTHKRLEGLQQRPLWLCVWSSFGTHKWQKPRMNLALYSISAAISMRRILYMLVKNFSSSALSVVTVVLGGSILCAANGLTCPQQSSALLGF